MRSEGDRTMKSEEPAAKVRRIIMRARNGDVKAQWLVAAAIFDFKDKRTWKRAFPWGLAAARGGHAVAQGWVSDCYRDGVGVKKNKREGFRWAKKSAKQGAVTGLIGLGWFYLWGDGVRRNPRAATLWLGRAAERGSNFERWELAMLYLGGYGVRRNCPKAAYWLKRIATHAETRAVRADAQLWLGEAYRTADGAQRDYTQAVKWFGCAARNGDDNARVLLGVHKFLGIGTKADRAGAVVLFREASKGGNACALQNLSLCYEHGIGVKRNRSRALELSRRALRKGLGSGGSSSEQSANESAWAQKIAKDRGLPVPAVPILVPRCRWRP